MWSHLESWRTSYDVLGCEHQSFAGLLLPLRSNHLVQHILRRDQSNFSLFYLLFRRDRSYYFSIFNEVFVFVVV